MLSGTVKRTRRIPSLRRAPLAARGWIASTALIVYGCLALSLAIMLVLALLVRARTKA
jgi:hypothetical protein